MCATLDLKILQLIPLLIRHTELAHDLLDEHNPDVAAMWIWNDDLVFAFNHAGMLAACNRTLKFSVPQFSDEFVPR